MKYAGVAENVKQLVENPPPNDEFIYELLLAYGTPKATIARLKSGQLNLSKEPNEVLLKKKVFFRAVEMNVGQAFCLSSPGKPSDGRQAGSLSNVGENLFEAIEELKTAKKTKTNDPRFLIVTDFEQILAIDRKTVDTLDVAYPGCSLAGVIASGTVENLPASDHECGGKVDDRSRPTNLMGLDSNFSFFLPWAGMEKTKLSNENPADVKAAEKMAKLFDAIRQDNADYMRHDAHAMNVFLGRLLFCLFAEDTGIFPENAVSNAIASHTAEDGSDLDAFFKQLFDWLDTPDRERGIHREGSQGTQKKTATTETTENTDGESLRSVRSFAVKSLPYVNGGLFRDHYDIPAFSAKSRRMLIEAGKLDWKDINPDIFGSMFQAVIDPEERHNLGQHYDPDTTKRSEKECHAVTGRSPTSRRGVQMPDGLREAHHNLDLAVDRLYRSKPFTSDEERLEHLFKLYEEMTAKEKLV